MQGRLIQGGYQFTGDNVAENPILSMFDEESKRVLGGFEVRWMPDKLMSYFLMGKDAVLEDYEAVLIRALPGMESDMHIHEHGCSIITCLGESYGFPSPATELMFGHYVPQRTKQVVRRVPLVDDGYTFITPYVVHAFHTPANGTSFALAVATPRVREAAEVFDFVTLARDQWEERT